MWGRIGSGKNDNPVLLVTGDAALRPADKLCETGHKHPSIIDIIDVSKLAVERAWWDYIFNVAK